MRLFHEGLGGKARSPELQDLLGRIPYLNGGFFEPHIIEQTYGRIQIPDRAFERIFDYFDQYQWHLDERPLRDDNEINPDVLGFIFEKYINQKQMGALYAGGHHRQHEPQHDHPLPVRRRPQGVQPAFAGDHAVWQLLQADPDRYIYPAIKHGIKLTSTASHPRRWSAAAAAPEIERAWTSPGQSDRTPQGMEQACAARARAAHRNLREVVARRQRYAELHTAG